MCSVDIVVKRDIIMRDLVLLCPVLPAFYKAFISKMIMAMKIK